MGTTPLPGDVDPEKIATRPEFAAALTAVREAAGLTVREVARAAGISPSTVGGYFSGRHLPPLRPEGGIRAILAACGVHDPAEVDAWQRTVTRIRRGPGPRPCALPPPYRGLAAYRLEDAPIFPGRDAEIRLLLDLLGADGESRRRQGRPDPPGEPGPPDSTEAAGGITVLLGKAGSGKTSLVAAGLLPHLQARGCRVAVLTPGEQPLRELALALADVTGGHADTAHDALVAGPSAVRRLLLPPVEPVEPIEPEGPVGGDRLIVLPGASPPAGPGGPTVIDRRPIVIVDRFEQLLDGPADRAEQEAFVRALAAAARPETRAASPAGVLVVLRSEAVAGVARFPDLAAALRAPDGASGGPGRAVALGPMTGDQIRAVILAPARSAGIEVDPDLVDAVLADVAELDRRGVTALPRVSQALLATWRRGRRTRLTVTAYREAGGVIGSVEAAAEQVYEALPAAVRARLPELFTGANTDDLEAAVQAFAEAGLLEPGSGRLQQAGPAGAGLVQGWPRLQAWLGAPDDVAATASAPARSDPPIPAILPLPLAPPDAPRARRPPSPEPEPAATGQTQPEPIMTDSADAPDEATSAPSRRLLLALAAVAVIALMALGVASTLGR